MQVLSSFLWSGTWQRASLLCKLLFVGVLFFPAGGNTLLYCLGTRLEQDKQKASWLVQCCLLPQMKPGPVTVVCMVTRQSMGHAWCDNPMHYKVQSLRLTDMALHMILMIILQRLVVANIVGLAIWLYKAHADKIWSSFICTFFMHSIISHMSLAVSKSLRDS